MQVYMKDTDKRRDMEAKFKGLGLRILVVSLFIEFSENFLSKSLHLVENRGLFDMISWLYVFFRADKKMGLSSCVIIIIKSNELIIFIQKFLFLGVDYLTKLTINRAYHQYDE